LTNDSLLVRVVVQPARLSSVQLEASARNCEVSVNGEYALSASGVANTDGSVAGIPLSIALVLGN